MVSFVKEMADLCKDRAHIERFVFDFSPAALAEMSLLEMRMVKRVQRSCRV